MTDAIASAAMMEPQYDSKMSAPIPATSPTLSPTLSAITPGFLGSSSGISASSFPTRSAPTSALLVKMPPPTRANNATSDAPIPKPLNTGSDSISVPSSRYSPPSPSSPTDATVSPITEPLRNASESAAASGPHHKGTPDLPAHEQQHGHENGGDDNRQHRVLPLQINDRSLANRISHLRNPAITRRLLLNHLMNQNRRKHSEHTCGRYKPDKLHIYQPSLVEVSRCASRSSSTLRKETPPRWRSVRQLPMILRSTAWRDV